MDTTEYKDMILGLTFLEHIWDALKEWQEQLIATVTDPKASTTTRSAGADIPISVTRTRVGLLTVLEQTERVAKYWASTA